MRSPRAPAQQGLRFGCPWIIAGLTLGADALGGLLLGASSPTCSWQSRCAPAVAPGTMPGSTSRKSTTAARYPKLTRPPSPATSSAIHTRTAPAGEQPADQGHEHRRAAARAVAVNPQRPFDPRNPASGRGFCALRYAFLVYSRWLSRSMATPAPADCWKPIVPSCRIRDGLFISRGRTACRRAV